MSTSETCRAGLPLTYPNMRLSLFPCKDISAQLRAFGQNDLHISTEGPPELAA